MPGLVGSHGCKHLYDPIHEAVLQVPADVAMDGVHSGEHSCNMLVLVPQRAVDCFGQCEDRGKVCAWTSCSVTHY